MSHPVNFFGKKLGTCDWIEIIDIDMIQFGNFQPEVPELESARGGDFVISMTHSALQVDIGEGKLIDYPLEIYIGKGKEY